MGNRVYVLSTYLYLVVALGLTVWYAQVLRHAHRFQVISGNDYRPTPINLVDQHRSRPGA
jgi:hypothetical protein